MSRPSVEQVENAISDTLDTGGDNMDAARAVLALFEPETVTTAAELDALPVGSVVLDPQGRAWQRVTSRWASVDPAWAYARISTDDLPATVLHRGGSRG